MTSHASTRSLHGATSAQRWAARRQKRRAHSRTEAVSSGRPWPRCVSSAHGSESIFWARRTHERNWACASTASMTWARRGGSSSSTGAAALLTVAEELWLRACKDASVCSKLSNGTRAAREAKASTGNAREHVATSWADFRNFSSSSSCPVSTATQSLQSTSSIGRSSCRTEPMGPRCISSCTRTTSPATRAGPSMHVETSSEAQARSSSSKLAGPAGRLARPCGDRDPASESLAFGPSAVSARFFDPGRARAEPAAPAGEK
mmetsp:Transcript_10711/g.25711  ORF Transcript_10711/g.25711 Transcript_10711/m.25711 type:complete len:262 (+) Transcript_10711:256-1041(+)